MISETIYCRHIIRARSAGNYFYFDRSYADIPGVSKLTALFLQDIYNIASMPNTAKKDIGGKEYFLCTSDFLERNGLKWSKEEQKYHLTMLRDRCGKKEEPNKVGPPLVHFCRQGIPPRRWVRIDVKAIEKELDKLEADAYQSAENNAHRTAEKHAQRSAENNAHQYKKERRRKERHGRTADAADSGFGGVHLNGSGNDRKIAAHLYEALLRKGLIPGKPNLAAWSKHIQKMFTIDGIPPERVKAGLDWYCEHIGEKYVSECYCTESFRKKFSAIEAAMRRGQTKKQEESFIW